MSASTGVAHRVEPGQPSPARVVLDTNVCLDLFVFDDPRVAPLHRAIAGGELVAVADAETRAEWARVLGYPMLRLDVARQAAALAAFDAAMRRVEHAGDLHTTPAVTAGPLPTCSDPDDQKFLVLARATGARWLLSRDRALLELSRRLERSDGCTVATPEAWAAATNRA
ncbi:PIN domain-containing protein [Cognatilysobacter tabacisoli]|uniref:PIN domain-containing protein n=1 Tax=Cognatilysobacter tabacisoli TaxID=2315424 RepID=UPI001E2988A0|nr:PIN domain-containing protein [Lysobacter tabacisoli]